MRSHLVAQYQYHQQIPDISDIYSACYSPLNTTIGGNNSGLLLRSSRLVVLSQGDSLKAPTLLGPPQDPPGVTHPGCGQGLALQERHHAGAATELTVNTAAAQSLVHLKETCSGKRSFNQSLDGVCPSGRTSCCSCTRTDSHCGHCPESS